MSEYDAFEPHHASSPTDHVLQELQLHGYRPFTDEPDPRPLPEGRRVAGAIADIFDALVSTLAETRLEPDLDDLLWSTVNLFHRAAHRLERALDDNEQAQRRSQQEQDGSEVQSVELERLTATGRTLIERRDAFELMRDQAAEQFERHTGSGWRPRSGSLVSHRNVTAAMIDSRDFLAARKHAVFTKAEAPRAGDLAIFILRPEEVEEGRLQCLIKRLVLEIPPWVTFPWRENPKSEVRALAVAAQSNPPCQYMIPCERLLAVVKFSHVQRRGGL